MWGKSTIIDTPVTNPLLWCVWERMQVVSTDNFLTYFFCNMGQSKRWYKRTWWDSVSVRCWDPLCFRTLTSSYSISKKRNIFLLYIESYICKIECVGEVVMDLCKYLMEGTKKRGIFGCSVNSIRIKMDKKNANGKVLFQQLLYSVPLVLWEIKLQD